MHSEKEQERVEKMIRELQILDRECSKANNCTILRRDFTMFGHNFQREGAEFLKDVEKTAVKSKRNNVVLVTVVKD